MARWTNVAEWVGTPVNFTRGGQRSVRGLVEHIAEGTYAGTIVWQRNPAAEVSSHFVVARDGRIAQMVDTADRAWCQRAGNPDWLSIENEGWPSTPLTDAQMVASATLLAECHDRHGTPIALAPAPTGLGLAWHSLGAEHGVDWGHPDCPGPIIKAQLPTIVAWAAIVHNGGKVMSMVSDPDFLALIYRVAGVIDMMDPIDDHAWTKTLPNRLAQVLRQIQADAHTAATRELAPVAIVPTDAQMAAFATQVAQLLPSPAAYAQAVREVLESIQFRFPPAI